MDRGLKSHETPLLRIGDYVMLRHQKPFDGFLTSEGLLLDECLICKSPDQSENCLWQIHIQGQYSALQEYDEALGVYNAHNSDISGNGNELEQSLARRRNVVSKEQLASLLKAAINERRLNEKLMQMKVGKAICFGDIIQLRHVKSGKFLSVSDHVLARQERENLRVTIKAKGSNLSYLSFIPRFKHDREGQTILDMSESYIRVHSRQGEYIHGAKKVNSASKFIEVNCSLDSTSFTISLYHQHSDVLSKLILPGQLISFQEPESLSWLTLDRRNPGLSERAKIVLSNQSDIHNHVGSNLLWFIEKENFSEGGRIALKSRFYLRDLNSGLFMKQEGERLVAVKEKSSATTFEFHNALGSDSSVIQKNSSVHLSSNGRWLCIASTKIDKGKYGFEVTMSSTEKNKAITFVVSSSIFQRNGTDLFVGVQATILLRKFEQLGCQLERSDAIDAELATELKIQTKQSFAILDNLKSFLSNLSLRSNASGEEFEDILYRSSTAEILLKRKVMIREQGLIDVLLDLLDLSSKIIFDPPKTNRSIDSPFKTGISPLRLLTDSTPRDKLNDFESSEDIAASYPSPSLSSPMETNPLLSQPKRREKRVTILSKIANITHQSNFDGISKESSHVAIREDDSMQHPDRRKMRNAFVGSSGSFTSHSPKRGSKFDFAESNEENLNSPGANSHEPLIKQSSITLNPVRNAFKTIGRRTSQMFSGGFLMNPTERESYISGSLVPDRLVSPSSRQEDKRSLSEDLTEVGLQVLLEAVRDHHENQMAVADRFPLILNLLGTHPAAVQLVEELLKDNLQILQTKVRQREIDIIVRLLYESEMNVTYLHILQSCCSCPFGVDSTQKMIAEAIFGHLNSTANHIPLLKPDVLSSESKELMIDASSSLKSSRMLTLNIFIRSSEYIPTEWPKASVYFNEDMLEDVWGSSLFRNGLARLSVSWERKVNGDFTMMKVFGASLPIDLETICAPLRNRNNLPIMKPGDLVQTKLNRQQSSLSSVRPLQRPTIRNKTILIKPTSPLSLDPVLQQSHKRAEIAEFLVKQLYLVADVCLDRNYVSMKLLEDSYPYDMLISILKSDLSPNIRAPAARIISSLYIDRYPQETVKYPKLIRLGSDNEENFENRIQNSAPQTRFGILQEVISEYLYKELDCCKSNALSVEITHLLLQLVEFNFYSSQNQVLDIIKPLTDALDNRRYVTTKSELINGSNDLNSQKDSGNTGNNVSAIKNKILRSSIFKSVNIKTNISPRGKVIPIINDRQSSSKLSRSESVSSESSQLYVDKFGAQSFSFEFRYVRFINSIQGMIAVLSIVIVTVIIAFNQIFSDHFNNEFNVFNYCVTGYFTVDIFLRIMFHFRANESITPFFKNIYNFIDSFLVLIDYVLIAVLALSDSRIANAGRVLRSLRAIKLLRIVRAARLIQRISANNVKKQWIPPKRYNTVTTSETHTMVNIIRCLTIIYRRIQHKHVGILIKAYRHWVSAHGKANGWKPSISGFEIYDELIKANEENIVFPDHFDEVLKDIIMYNEPIFVEEALKLLMLHKNQKQLVLNVASQAHLIFTEPFEELYGSISSMLRKLKQLLEMYELWEGLKTDDQRNNAREALTIVERIYDFLVSPNYKRSLTMKFPYLVDGEVQIILRNLDAMDTFMFVLETLYDGGREVPSKPAQAIMKAVIKVICSFVKSSPENQAETFKHFNWFVERVDDNIGSEKVLREVLSGNRELIKQCPRHLIYDFTKKINTKGKRPEYLDLFVGMTESSEDVPINAQENNLGKFVVSQEWKDHVLLWCSSDEYIQRRDAMEAYSSQLGEAYEDEETLPSDIKYHVKLLTILTGCNLGPKLQAVYPTDDILRALLDSSTLFIVRKGLANLLIRSINAGLDQVRYSEYLWKFLDVIIKFFENSIADLAQFVKNERTTVQQIIDRHEWLEISISLISVVFQDFDISNFNDIGRSHDEFKYSILSEQAIKATIRKIFTCLTNLMETHTSIIGNAMHENILISLSNLSFYCDSLAIDIEAVEDISLATVKKKRSHRINSVFKNKDDEELKHRETYKLFLDDIKNSYDQFELSNSSVLMFEMIPSQYDLQANSDVRLEPFVHKIASHIRSHIHTSPSSRSLSADTSSAAMWILQSFRQIMEKHLGWTVNLKDLRMKAISLKKNELSKADFYRKVLNENGMVPLCMDLISLGIDRELSVEAIKLLITLLNENGGSLLIQHSIYNYLYETDSSFFFEFLKNEIDNVNIFMVNQVEVNEIEENNYADGEHSHYSHEREFNQSYERGSLPDLIVFFLIQSMCEGEYSKIKNFLREQSKNSRAVNIFEPICNLADFLSRNDTPECATVAVTVLKTIKKLMLGPCKGNQEHLIIHTELLVSLNRYMRLYRASMNSSFCVIKATKNLSKKIIDKSKNYHANYESIQLVNNLDILKESVIDVLRAAVECQPKTSVVFERVTTAIEFTVLNLILLPHDVQQKYQETRTVSTEESLEISSKISNLQAKYLVFSETLGHPKTLLPELAVDKIRNEIASIEVVWKGEVHKVHFHILDICKELSQESKAEVTADIDGVSHEVKLIEFTRRSRKLFIEARHQQFLRNVGLSKLVSMKTKLTFIMFINAVVMNIIILSFLGSGSKDAISASHRRMSLFVSPAAGSNDDSHGSGAVYEALPVYFDHRADNVLFGLNVVQIIFASTIVVLIVVGQLPVTYNIHIDNGKNILESVFATAVEPLPLWYACYLIIAVFGIVYNRLWLTGLLLDWLALDSTSQYLLKAVHNPAKQLFAAAVIILIFVNVFSAIYFHYFRDEVVSFNIFDLWEAFKLSMSYGIRGEYGVSHEMTLTLGKRTVLDMAFYFIILALLRHVFFAIIVDTFGKLREEKFERDQEANNTCLICGYERHDYDNLSHQGNNFSFSDHRWQTHNPLHYMYYMMHIWSQPRVEDNGIEIHVRKCLMSGNVGWFPIGIVTDTQDVMDKTFDVQASGDKIFNSSHDVLSVSQTLPEKILRESSFTSHGHGGLSVHHVRSAGIGDLHESVIMEKLNVIQKQVAMLAEAMNINNARTSILSVPNNRQGSLYNNNTYEQSRLSERFRMSTMIPQISEVSNEDDDDQADISNPDRIFQGNPSFMFPSRDFNGSFKSSGSEGTAMTDVISTIASLSKSVQEMSAKLNMKPDIVQATPTPQPVLSALPTTQQKIISPSSASLDSQLSVSKLLSEASNSNVLTTQSSGILKPSEIARGLVSEKSSSSIKSVSEAGSEDSSDTISSPEVMMQKLEAMRSNANLMRTLQKSPSAGLPALNKAISGLNSSTPRQQERESVIGPSRDLIGLSPTSADKPPDHIQ